MFGVINILSLEVLTLEPSSKDSANLSMSVLQNLQGYHEDCWIFTTKIPGLVSSTFQSNFQGQFYLFWQVKTFLITIISEPTNMIIRRAGSCDPAGRGVAMTQVRGREKGHGTSDPWHLFYEWKQISGASIVLSPGCLSASNNLTTTWYRPGLLTGVMNL